MAMTHTKRTKSSKAMQAVNGVNSTGPSKNTRTAKKTRGRSSSVTPIKFVVKTERSGNDWVDIQTNEIDVAADDEMTSGDDESDTNTIHEVSDVESNDTSIDVESTA